MKLGEVSLLEFWYQLYKVLSNTVEEYFMLCVYTQYSYKNSHVKFDSSLNICFMYLIFAVLKIESRALYLLAKCSTLALCF